MNLTFYQLLFFAKIRVVLISVGMLLTCTIAFGQNQRLIAPEKLGPNALPIPEIKTGKLANDFNLKVALEGHYSDGDNTKNGYLELFIPAVTEKVALVLSVVPYESYELGPQVIDFRSITTGETKGSANGDLYVGTQFQLFKDKKQIPDVLLSIDIKTASGNNLRNARYSDTPGYIFDLSTGKEITINSTFLPSLRVYGMAGFYVYQTNRQVYRQNDAFLYGAGVDLNFNKFIVTNAFGGYSGYIDDGDKPSVYRAGIRTKLSSSINYELRFSKGFKSNFYDAIRIGVNIDLNFLKTIFKNETALTQ